MIKIENITKTYKMGLIDVHALNDVSFTIKKNEFVSIMGPSGSGKSTLMNIIGCLDTPTSGKYFLDDISVEAMGDNDLAKIRNKKIGFVFQTFNLLPRTDALKNVELPLIYSGVSSKERHRKAKELLTNVGLGDRINHNPSELSGGQRQRVAIARALVNDPAIILADEPTGNLDSKAGEEIMEIFSELHKKGATIILVTHERYVAEFADRIIHLFDGKIVSDENVPKNNREK
ncbi:MAG: ABC transporter ATP-binding protein [bacterium]|nr:ABC transporter ATP-binding protein [bacterium]